MHHETLVEDIFLKDDDARWLSDLGTRFEQEDVHTAIIQTEAAVWIHVMFAVCHGSEKRSFLDIQSSYFNVQYLLKMLQRRIKPPTGS